ncbi:MAG: AI-2E family transporter [Actinomycetales bacterium]|nr:AI-2E family transporter [Actinomycetales bacterium]
MALKGSSSTTNEDGHSHVMTISLDRNGLSRTLRTITIWLALASIGLWVFRSNGNFLFLLLLAWLFSIAIEPPVGALANRGWKRGAATGLVMLIVIAVFAGFIAVFGGIFFNQAVQFINSLPTVVTDAVDWLNKTFNLDLNPKDVISSLNVTPSQIATWTANFSGGVVGFLTSIIGGVFQVMTALLFSFYFCADGPRLRRVIGAWFPPAGQKVFVTTWDLAVQKTGGFVMSKVILALISFTVHATFFAAIGVPYWLAMALITGLVSQFIPTIGTYIAILIPMLVAFFNDPLDALWVVLFASFWQQVENYLISPRISKMTMNIHPAIAFGSVIVFANLFGPLGAVISIPLAAVLVAALDTYGNRYELIPELREVEKSENLEPESM